MNRKVVYVAGAYRGPNAYAIELNIRKAEDAGLWLAEQGAVPLIPHTMYRYYQGALPDAFWLDATLGLLERSDAIFLLDNFEQSQGALAERQAAVARGMPLFYQKRDESSLCAWVLGLHSRLPT